MTATQPQPSALPPAAVVYQLSIGHYVSRALHVAAQLGVADALARGPLAAEDLARAVGADAAALRRVVRLLASAGVFEEQADGRFALLPLGDLMREDAPGSMRAAVMLFAGPRIQESWAELEWCVRTGQPAFRKDDPNADPFTAMEKDPAAAANFDKAMAAFTAQTAVAVAAAYDFSRFARVADVGGGNGALLIGILRANPKLRGFVFDQPHVAERARAHLAESGVADRCEAVGGSFFDKVPPGADAYLLKHVIHDWNDAQATHILRNVRAAVPAGGKLLLVEGVYPERIEANLACRGAASNDVNMLVVTGGRQRSADEFRELYAASGFRLARIVPTASGVAVIEGEPA